MSPLITKLTHFLREHEVQNGILLIGVSGGADSVALLRGVLDVKDEMGLSVRVVHVDHGLRECSRADGKWVQSLCTAFSAACEIERVKLHADSDAAGVEETARRARYEVFKRAATASGARWVATAHTADDQVETVLHHILRGTGLKGLRGIPRRRTLCESIDVIRPLLDVSRQEVESYLSELQQDYRTDPTNLETEYTRNRLRRIVLPSLRTESSGRVDQSLLRLSRQVDEVQQFIESEAGGLLQRALLESTPHLARLNCAQMSGAPMLILREAFNLLWRRCDWPRQPMTFEHWQSLAELAGEQSAKRSFPGQMQVEKRGSLMVITCDLRPRSRCR